MRAARPEPARLRDDVRIRPYAPGDLWLLERLLGDPVTTAFIGGPEPPEAIRARHERYLESDGSTDGLFTVVAGPRRAPAGWVGYWEITWHGEPAWECGWSVLPELQRTGIATAAMRLLLAELRARGGHRYAHAFPSLDNDASNALCRRLGFELVEETAIEVEYPEGRVLRSYDWRLDVFAGGPAPAPG